MASECYDDQIKMKRIDAIKQMFHAFANRSMAYNFHHVIGLVRFGGKIEILHTFTEIFETFKEYIDNLEAKGCTKLYDALDYSIKELKGIKQQFPECSLRILCLTDGNDVGSSSNPVQTAVKLIDSKIVVDSVIIGEVENYVLHGISNVTGGCCFKPSSSENALKIFEMETVLSMKDRKPKMFFLFFYFLYSATPHLIKEQPSGHRKRRYHKLIYLRNYKIVSSFSYRVVKKKSKDFKTGKVMEKDRRIIEELRSLHCSPHPYYKVFPSETDMTFWQILLLGPPDTPYENGVFLLYCKFEDEYPQKPPLVRFITPIYHCNVNSVGRICHQIFDRNYSAHITMKEVLEAVYGLLIAPEPEDPLDSILAEEYLSSKGKYLEQARKTTADYASTSLEDM
uniref:UBC core domain-containing protein n=1 Tax=Lepisosteus oculatus TaxID=7918 RepID=W5LVP4_LEPOC